MLSYPHARRHIADHRVGVGLQADALSAAKEPGSASAVAWAGMWMNSDVAPARRATLVWWPGR